MFCIGIYRRSRASYKYLSKYLSCPSITTLDTALEHIPLNSGCNNIIQKYLKLVVQEIEEKDLYCILIWDEMSIQSAVYYNSKNDKVIGFEDWGMKRTRKFADHAIVFYIRCLSSGNHMPIGYGFCNSTTNTPQLVRCIKQWLTILIKCGLKPVATVCDQGATNVAAINSLIHEANLSRHRSHKNPSK
ncbi:PREDICTED: uncharacterized protein LOC105555787 [Vollenhovia emeryi]|uniref:uncharacterized protein LOC105555787 n=1 Tax=Vollenhovia emeryi TaxID=411798 RepID=UPI0005F41644|nr:PREDICTED: uncharacterized protein LOC105555787 [Vollenhovia emeryi]